jgi:hypothetical protein
MIWDVTKAQTSFAEAPTMTLRRLPGQAATPPWSSEMIVFRGPFFGMVKNR